MAKQLAPGTRLAATDADGNTVWFTVRGYRDGLLIVGVDPAPAPAPAE